MYFLGGLASVVAVSFVIVATTPRVAPMISHPKSDTRNGHPMIRRCANLYESPWLLECKFSEQAHVDD